MAGVLVGFLYVQGLDLGVGDAGTVLVDGEGRSTGETCLPGRGWVQRRTHSSWSGGESLRVAVKAQRSKHREDMAVRVGFVSQVCEWREIGGW